MTNKDFEKIESKLMEIVDTAAPEDVCLAAQTWVDIYCQIANLKIDKDRHAMEVNAMKPAGVYDGTVVSQYANNEFIYKLVKEINPEELVMPLAKKSEIYTKVEFAVASDSVYNTKQASLLELARVDDHFIAMIHGGNNGNGEWPNYFTQLSNIFATLRSEGYDAWLIKCENDCLDDVWNAFIGIKKA